MSLLGAGAAEYLDFKYSWKMEKHENGKFFVAVEEQPSIWKWCQDIVPAVEAATPALTNGPWIDNKSWTGGDKSGWKSGDDSGSGSLYTGCSDAAWKGTADDWHAKGSAWSGNDTSSAWNGAHGDGSVWKGANADGTGSEWHKDGDKSAGKGGDKNESAWCEGGDGAAWSTAGDNAAQKLCNHNGSWNSAWEAQSNTAKDVVETAKMDPPEFSELYKNKDGRPCIWSPTHKLEKFLKRASSGGADDWSVMKTKDADYYAISPSAACAPINLREYFGPINTSEDSDDEDEEQEESEEEDVEQDEVDEEKEVLQSKMTGISNVLLQQQETLQKSVQAATKALADASAAAVDAKKDEDTKSALMLKAAEAQAVSPTEETLAALNQAQKAHAEAKLFSLSSTHFVSMAQQALNITTEQQCSLANVFAKGLPDSAAVDNTQHAATETDAAGGKGVSSGQAEEPAPSAGSGTLPDSLPLAHLGAGEGLIELGKHMGSQIDNQ